MKIAVVAPLVTAIREPQLGGSQALVADLARALGERGHQVDVFASTGSLIDGVRVVDTGVEPAALGASLFRPGQTRVRATDEARRAFARVYELVRGRSYDVVHNHAFDAPAIELATDLAGAVVHTLHLGPDREIAAALDGVAGTVVCVSDAQRRAWAELIEVDVVIRNGVPVERIPWSASGGRRALYAGRLSPEKGVAQAIEIAGAAGVSIVVVGSAYDASYAKALRESFALREDVAFRDALPRPALWRLMSESRVVLCPASWEEPFGLVAAEAQAAGTPVVAFRRGALPEVVADTVTGFLVDDVAAAVGAVRRVDGIDRRACRRHAERDLSIEATAEAHVRLYERLLQPVR